PLERRARDLTDSCPPVEALVRLDPSSVRYKVELPASGRSVPFDLVIERRGGSLFRTVGIGEPGFAILARQGPDAPTRSDLERLEHDVESVARRMDSLPVRAILLRTKPIPIPEEVYEFAVGHPVFLRRGFDSHRVTLE